MVNTISTSMFEPAKQWLQWANQLIVWVGMLSIICILCKRGIIPNYTFGIAVTVKELPITEAFNSTFTVTIYQPDGLVVATGLILGVGVLLLILLVLCCRPTIYLTTHKGRVRKFFECRGLINNYIIRFMMHVRKPFLCEIYEMEVTIEFALESNKDIPITARYLRLQSIHHSLVIVERGPSYRLEFLSPIEFEACRSDGQVVGVYHHFVSIPLNAIDWEKGNAPIAFNVDDYGDGSTQLIGRYSKDLSPYDMPLGHTFMQTSVL